MAVLVKRAEAFMPLYMESKSLRDPLNGQVAKLFDFKSIHNYSLRRYSSVLVYSPVSALKVMNLRNTHLRS